MVEEQQVLLHVGFGDNTASFINVRFFVSAATPRDFHGHSWMVDTDASR